MNISHYILESLKKNGKASVPEFGVFTLKNIPAKLDAASGNIAPPATEVFLDVDYENGSDEFVKFIQVLENITADRAAEDLSKTVSYWKKTLEGSGEFEIENIGKLYNSENGIVFHGKKIDATDPSFYGLEEINIDNLKKVSTNCPPEAGEYRFTRSVLWLFLLIIPVAGLLFLAFTNKEMLFGKKSFENISVKNATHRITRDSTSILKKKADSTALDSLKADSIKTLNAAPVKKWSAQKYRSSKWRKPKKQANR